VKYQSLSDAELLEKLVHSDREAFHVIYTRYARRLFDLACRKVAPEIAEEIVQDIFVRLWQKPEVSVEHLSAYLFSAVRYGLLNHFRDELIREKFIAHSLQQAPCEYMPDENLTAELQQVVQNAIASLPEKTQVVFHLSRFEGLSHKEIAMQLSLSEKSVEYHISQAIKRLRQSLQPFLQAILLTFYFNS